MNVQFNTETTAKKHLIYESTLRLIREFGFHGTPMSQIAQAAGVATGTIYHYFTSKDELIIELYHYARERVQQVILGSKDHTLPYPEQFSNVWMNLVKHYVQHPELLSFLEQFFSSPYVKDIYPEGHVGLQDEISELLKQGIQEDYIKELDINIISAAYIGTISATAKRNINGHFALQEEDLKKMVAIIWDGIKN